MKKMSAASLIAMAFCLPSILGGFSFVPSMPLETTPSWISSAQSNYGTGGALVDLDRDGWLDFVTANGNDILRQRVSVYYNNGDGTLPLTPQWISDDIDYHGHLSVGDIDKDGWMDVAVSVYLGPGGFSDPGRVKVYMNDGTGQLEGSPSWESADEFFTFSCALGDADGDGDLDLAVATGEAYYGYNQQNRIYYNEGGQLETTPGWTSNETDAAYDASWGDMDNDGDLDLAFTSEGSGNRIYINEDGIIGNAAGWSSQDGVGYGNTITWGDVDGDGWLDLAVADNDQLGGTGHFKVYFNNGTGTLEGTPDWVSATGGYGSSVSFMDVDNDGDLDLAAGRWWSDAMIYENTGSTLTTTPSWTSTTNSVIEVMVWGDVDRDGLRVTVNEPHSANGVKKVFYVDHVPVHRLMAVRVDNSIVPPSSYCYDPASGWISLSFAPEDGQTVRVTYQHTTSPDLGITNWDSSIGNYLFYHDPVPPSARGHTVAVPLP